MCCFDLEREKSFKKQFCDIAILAIADEESERRRSSTSNTLMPPPSWYHRSKSTTGSPAVSPDRLTVDHYLLAPFGKATRTRTPTPPLPVRPSVLSHLTTTDRSPPASCVTRRPTTVTLTPRCGKDHLLSSV